MIKKRVDNVSWSRVLVPFIFVTWVLLSFIAETSRPNVPKEEYATFTHDQYDFSIVYPTKWQAIGYDWRGAAYDSSVKMELVLTRRGIFRIEIRQYQTAQSPTLQDVSNWGNVMMSKIQTIEEVEEYSDMINGHPVIRNRYKWGSYTTESVYIARSSDMIIISMQVKQDDYDANIDDFNAIVESFRPFE